MNDKYILIIYHQSGFLLYRFNSQQAAEDANNAVMEMCPHCKTAIIID